MAKTTRGQWIFIGVLCLPGLAFLQGYFTGRIDAEALLHPTGETSARLMIIAMLITPLRLMFPQTRWLKWMLGVRRELGIAAFAYAAAHTVFYVVDMASLQLILDEVGALGIWTGWVAMFIFIPLAITSNNAAVSCLGRRWKTLHQWVYAAAVLTLLHWIFVHNNLGPALVHFVPLLLLSLYRLYHLRNRTASATRI